MSEYTDKTAKKNKPNYLYAIISVALVLFLLGFFGLVILHAKKLITTYKENLNISIELSESASMAEIDSLQNALDNFTFVKPGSTRFISKEEAVDLMKDEFGEDFLERLDLPNPFFNVITFNVRANYLVPDSLKNIKETLTNTPKVLDVNYPENVTQRIDNNIRRLSIMAAAIAVFFILVAVTLIHNTIRLALYSNRFLIKNMELVGASWEFISRPYIRRAIWHGFISSIIAIIALVAMMYWFWLNLPEMRALLDPVGYAALGVLITVIGILINSTSTYFVVNKYLKMRIDDLY